MSIKRNCLIAALGMCAFSVVAGIARSADTGAPASVQTPVLDTYHGVTVSDPYRWLEDASSPAVHAWSAAQDARTRKYFDALPQRAPIYDQLLRQISGASSSYYGLQAVEGRLFAFYSQPPKQQAMIAVMPNSADPAQGHHGHRLVRGLPRRQAGCGVLV
jgi:prolyl oligopeptidase